MTYGARQYGGGYRSLTSADVAGISAYPAAPETAITAFTNPVTSFSSYVTAVMSNSPYAYYQLSDPIKYVDATFDPNTVSGLVAWLNPTTLGLADGVTASTAPAVNSQAAWAALPAGGPTYKASGINGRPYLQTFVNGKGLYWPTNLANPCTIFGVAKIRTGGSSLRVFASQANNWLMGWHGGLEDRGYFVGWTYGELSEGGGQVQGPANSNLLRTYSLRINGTSGAPVMRKNNTALPPNTSTFGTAGPNQFNINGYGPGASEYSDADVYEVLLFNRALTDTEFSRVTDYLGAKYGTFTSKTLGSNTIQDASGNGRNALLTSGEATILVPGQAALTDRGHSLKFGTSQYAVAQTPFTNGFSAFTVEALVRPEGGTPVVQGYLTATWQLSSVVGNNYQYSGLNLLNGATIASGDYLEYDVYWVSGPTGAAASGTNLQMAMDIVFTNGNVLRGAGVDQNGISAHPSADLSALASGQYYSRRISLASYVGYSITQLMIVNESDGPTGTYVARFRNIRITNAGAADRVAYVDDSPGSPPSTPTTTTSGTPGNQGTTFTSLVQSGATGGLVGRVFTKSSYFATATTDFPFSLDHGANGKFTVILDSGNDFTADSTTTSTYSYARDATHHVAVVVRNSGVCELWVNGVQDSTWTIAFALSTGSQPWTLGGVALENGGGVGGLRFLGRASHWAIYNTALTGAAIQAHWAALTPVGTPKGTNTYNYTGSPVSYVVPAGVTQLTVDCYGARGGNYTTYAQGGFGGYVRAIVPVTPGETLTIRVGQQGQSLGYSTSTSAGGYNGGAPGYGTGGAGGGGQSDVYRSSTPLMIAGAGGGAAGGSPYAARPDGGAGGGLIGGTGVTNTAAGSAGGTGGTQSAGGTGGGGFTGNGTQGAGGQGSNTTTSSYQGGGGGAGYWGGGGGGYGGGNTAGSGGGGGSSYTAAGLIDPYHVQGARNGDGLVVVSWNIPAALTGYWESR